MIKKPEVTLEEIRASREHKVGLPPTNRYGEKVPKTGTHCSNCEYLTDDKKHCKNENFIAWEGKDKPAGSDKIPGGDSDRYCSIWWSNVNEGEASADMRKRNEATDWRR